MERIKEEAIGHSFRTIGHIAKFNATYIAHYNNNVLYKILYYIDGNPLGMVVLSDNYVPKDLCGYFIVPNVYICKHEEYIIYDRIGKSTVHETLDEILESLDWAQISGTSAMTSGTLH